MMLLRVAMLVLAVVQTLFTGLTAAVGAFADGGDVWSRLLIVGLHPVCAIGLLILGSAAPATCRDSSVNRSAPGS